MRKLAWITFFPWVALACVGDNAVATDGGADVTVSDASQDTTNDVTSDTSTDVVDAGTIYSDITDKTHWATLDLATLTSGATGYSGATFDGKYVYYVPNGSTALMRYDTTKPFATANFEKYDLSQTTSLVGFAGALFDGTYVYLVPYKSGSTYHGHLVRYNTTKAFTATTSYEMYDLTAVSSGSTGFSPGAFDGKYLYFTPYIQGYPTRFDKAAVFDAAASYETHTLTLILRWSAGAFDGKYVYFSPYYDTSGTGQFSGAVERFDTTGVFTTGIGQGGPWMDYDLAPSVDTNAVGFQGAIFDGRYLYIVPYEKSIAVRYDTQAQFDSATSWSKIDLSTVNAGAGTYVGGTFDGRYVYFVPYGRSPSSFHGLATRYDTLQPFTSTTSWQTFDLSTKDPNAKGFEGAAFDGEYVYFVPTHGTVAVRFDAKTPPSLPSFASSFY